MRAKKSFNLPELMEELSSRSLLKNMIQLKNGLEERHEYYAYCGFDPTAKSLHMGHLIPINILRLAKKHGAKSIAIVGCATAEIGDPTDKMQSRQLISKAQIAENASGVVKQLKQIGKIDFVVDNKSWLGEISVLEFIRIALDFSLNNIVKMQTFEKRLSENLPLSVGETLYPILQAYDWALFNGMPAKINPERLDAKDLFEEFERIKNKGSCFRCIQVSGSDQYGNMVQGQRYINKILNIEVFGVTGNLLTMKSGEKMGKSLMGALYLDPKLVTPYDFFQAIINFDDSCAHRIALQLVLDVEPDEIKKIFDADIQEAKMWLAHKLTELIHGPEEARKAAEKTQSIFVDSSHNMLDEVQWPKGIETMKLEQLVVLCDLAESISGAARAILGREIRVDQNIVKDPNAILEKKAYVISRGKKRHKKVVIDAA